MLVTFSTDAYSDITMFGDYALTLLKMMGHSATVPGAIREEDVPQALDHLKAALDREKTAQSGGDSDDDHISIDKRGLPLINLLTAAARAGNNVMWK